MRNIILSFILQFLIVLQCFSQVSKVEKFILENPPFIGLFRGSEVYEGSLGSGISYIPGSVNEFYMITDRGPNIFGYRTINGIPATLIIFPTYAPKIFRARLENNSITILNRITIKQPNKIEVTGVPFYDENYSKSETLLGYPTEVELSLDPWGIDSEGIATGKNNDFWVCEEYRPSILHIDNNGLILKRYQPFRLMDLDLPLDSVLAKRLPNRGFEGITITPEGKIYAVMQSAIGYPEIKIGSVSRIHRIVELNPADNEVKMYAYVHNKPEGKLTEFDIRIGDIAAINNNEFLIIEHGIIEESFVYKIYKIDITGATPVTNTEYTAGYLEELIDSLNLVSNGIIPVTKNFYLDLTTIGWNPEIGKCEGIAIMNDSTIALMNDNDYGMDYKDVSNIKVDKNKESILFKINVTGSLKLTNYLPLK